MRLKKLSLIAAAVGLGVIPLTAATTTVISGTNSTITNAGGSTNYYISSGANLTLDSTISTTYDGKLLGYGNVTKTGSGTLELRGFASELTGSGGYFNNSTFMTTQGATLTGLPADLYTLGAATGTLHITSGEVVVTGYINQYIGYDSGDISTLITGSYATNVQNAAIAALAGYGNVAGMTWNPKLLDPSFSNSDTDIVGFSSTVLEGNAMLSFRNASLNIPNFTPTGLGDRTPDPGAVPGTNSVQYVHNLKAGAGDDQVNTQLETGLMSTSRLIVYTDSGTTGSIGIISGTGGLAFNGDGTFKILNDSRFTGNVVIAGGTLSLESAFGGSLASAASVNFAAYFGNQGTNVIGYAQPGHSVDYRNNDGALVSEEWQPAYVPDATGSATLNVTGSQTISNFQGLFVDDSNYLTTRALFPAEPYIADRGDGTAVNFATPTTKLTINQNIDGLYYGNFTATSGGGILVKQGTATLALEGSSSSLSEIDILAGTLISNVNMLGTGVVNIGSGGTLTIVQPTPGTLRASIQGDTGGTLILGATGQVTQTYGNVGLINVGNGSVGSIDIITAQPNYYGAIVIRDGLIVSFHAGTGNTFINASSVSLSGGAANVATTLTFNDTNQTFNNFSGDAKSVVNLGRGTITLVQNVDGGAFAGQIIGTGSFVKDGPANLTLSGRDSQTNLSTDTYAGATVVRGGTLTLAGANQLPGTSGVILRNGGKLVVSGDQSFATLFGEAGTTLAMGANNLTLGLLPATEAAMHQAFVSSPVVTPGYYLGIGATDPLSVGTSFNGTAYNGAATTAFLQSVGMSAADAGALAFAGTITGSGGLTKIGTQRIILTGQNTYTGATSVQGGTLQIDWNSIAKSAITVSSGAALSVNVDANDSQTFSQAINGGGNFEKVGSGDLTLANAAMVYGGQTLVSAGTLRLTLNGSLAGTVSIASGATLVATQNADLTFAPAVTGLGTFEKDGTGTLTLLNSVGFQGAFAVDAGTLAVPTLPASVLNAVNISSGATFAVNLTAAATYNGTVTGAGVFAVNGAPVTFGASSTDFTGTVSAKNSTIKAGVADIFPAATIALTGSTFDLNGTTQHITAFSGDATSVIALTRNGSSSTLVFAPPVGVTRDFSGIITSVDPGAGILKEGLGTQRLSTPQLLNWVGTTTVDAGVLESTVYALGQSDVVVHAGGTLAFLNNDTDNPGVYGRAITGVGTIGKTGAGVVDLTNASAAFNGSISVGEGELHVSSAGIGPVGPTGNLFGNTVVATGDTGFIAPGAISIAGAGIYAVAMSADTTLDSTALGNHVSDAAAILNPKTGQYVLQHGSVAVEGARTLTLAHGQVYSGNTILRNGATLDLVDSVDASGSPGLYTLNGLAGTSGTTVLTGGNALTIRQSVDGVYNGGFDSLTSLTVTAGDNVTAGDYASAGKLSLTNANGVTSATVISIEHNGRLALDASLTATVNLTGNGSLYFDTSVNNEVYQGNVVGSGNILKTGNPLDSNGMPIAMTLADTTAFRNIGGIGVDQGVLNVNVAGVGSNITSLISQGQGVLGLSVDAGATTKLGASADAVSNLAITGDGTVSKIGAGTLLLGDTANPYTITATGLFTIAQGALGGTFTTSGSLAVAPGATLAPGNSPGLVTVNGNLMAAGNLALQLTAANVTPGVDFDAIHVNGSVILGTGLGTGNATGQGAIFQISQYGAAPLVSGTAYKVITATNGIFAQDGDFKVEVSKSAGLLNVVLVTPSRYNTLLGYGLSPSMVPNDPNSIYVYYAPNIATLAGHDGLAGLTGVLNGFIGGASSSSSDPYYTSGMPNAIGGSLAFSSPASIARAVTNLSPLGYGSFYAMGRDTSLRQEDEIADRLEQRRYDGAGFAHQEWEAFVVASASMAKNDSGASTPTFDYTTYGGLVGLDKKLSDGGPLVGGAIGYDSGTATLHDSGGKMEMNRTRATAFLSSLVTSRWYVDAGLSAGFGDYTSKRYTLLSPQNTGSTTGYDLGANIRTGTVYVLTENLHLTPYASLSYAHYEFQGLTENGSQSALKLNGWSQDSMRASLGSGLGWWIDPGADWKWKLGVDVSYNHEFLDTDSKLNASFAGFSGSDFSTTAAALPADSVSVGPNVGLFFNETTSVSAGMNFEYGFDGRTYTGFNVAFRKRF